MVQTNDKIILNIKGYFITIDTSDYLLISKYTWRPNKIKDQPWLIYFRTYTEGSHTTRKEILMHRLIMGCTYKDGINIDHIDGNTLNNSKSNLRRCSISQNVANARKAPNKSSPYKGVTLDAKSGKWKVTITCKGRSYHLGYYINILDAAKTYNEKAIELFGEFAKINTIPEED